MATAKEMRDLSVEELRRRAGELREGLFNMRIKHRTGALESSADLPKNRKELARVLTVLREKERLAVEQKKA
ncbi:MAG: 50S ribosomal protein L29 [Myxococcales bacterium]|jgi:large subunit ribosomal protein L29